MRMDEIEQYRALIKENIDYERLLDNLKDMLLRLDCLHGDNPDYFLMPWRRLLARAQVRRHEYDALMGLCRQVRNKLDGGNTA